MHLILTSLKLRGTGSSLASAGSPESSPAGSPVRRLRLTAAAAVFLAMGAACASSDESTNGSADSNAGAPGNGNEGGFEVGSGAAGGSDGGAGEPPPEAEIESSFRAPVSTGKYIWSANPDTGRVALVDANTLAVTLYDAGFRPTQIAGVPASESESDPNAGAKETAIVLNEGSRDATLLSVDDNAAVTERTFDLHAGASHWAVSSSGGWAIAWTDVGRYAHPDPLDGFQDATAIDLVSGVSTRLSVGFRPSRWFFSGTEDRAFAITQDGISTVGLDAEGLGAKLGPLIGLDGADPDVQPDVTITRDGSYALVRTDGSAIVQILDLSDNSIIEVELSGPITDLDLSETGEFAVAVVREQSELVKLPFPAIVSDPTAFQTVVVTGETFGSVALSADGSLGVAYTNATPNPRVTLFAFDVNRDEIETRSVGLKAPVTAAFPAADGSHVLTLMGVPDGSTKVGAFAVIPADEARAPKIVGTDAKPAQVAMAPSSNGALVTVANENGGFGVYVVRSATLQVDFVELASRPLAAGMVSSTEVERGFVAQEHAEGRITFVELESGDVRTLTGFELAAKVVDGS